MSENYERREVKSVSCSALPTVAGGIVIAAGLAVVILKSLSTVAKEAYRINAKRTSTVTPNAIKSPGMLSREDRIINGGPALNPVEAIKVSTLLQVSSAQYIVDNPSTIRQKLEALQLASTRAEAQKARDNLIIELESSHQRLFVKSLAIACAKASVNVGFPVVETNATPNGSIRVIATDSLGRALVSEISARLQNPTIVTETVGIRDGFCKKIMDAFDKSLVEQGVQSTTPKRKFTGGVCELEAVKEFLHKRMRPGTSGGESGIKRSRLLNNRGKQLGQRG